MCPRFIRSPIKRLWLCGWQMLLLLKMFLVVHSWILLLWVLLHRLTVVGRHALLIASSGAQHSIPPPRQDEDAHGYTEEEYTYFSAHDPCKVSSSVVSFRHTRLLGMHIAIPFDRIKFDWVLCVGISLEHLIELRIMLLPVPLFEGYSLRGFGVGRPRLTCHFFEVATLVISTVILLLISATAPLHFCDYKKYN